ncbi:MAG: hypothetical protein SGPRY_007241 [Prymnesium sp.]
MASSDQMQTKKAERRRIMTSESYKRGGAPFEKGIHKGVQEKMSSQFAGEILEEMKASPFREVTMGEDANSVTFVLAKEFGFCWGVERSIELAWAAREAYPDKTMHITNELIHNPGVNNLLQDMDISFIEKDEKSEYGKRFDAVGEGDVVILPAFGASLEEMQLLDKKGVTTVDTTCPWVSKAIATASMCDTYLIIKDMKQAEEIASYILQARLHLENATHPDEQEPGCLTDEELLAKYKHAASPHFHPKKHLKKIGIANQTTMALKTAPLSAQAIGRLFEKTMMAAFGPDEIKERFIAFDTICDATQVRQDAIAEMTESPDELDFILVVGGWDSSNTAHLLEIPIHAGRKGYHVNVGYIPSPTLELLDSSLHRARQIASCIRPDNSIEHRDINGEIRVQVCDLSICDGTPQTITSLALQENFLPLDRPARIGVTSGASTPDSVVQECIEQIVLLKKLAPVA